MRIPRIALFFVAGLGLLGCGAELEEDGDGLLAPAPGGQFQPGPTATPQPSVQVDRQIGVVENLRQRLVNVVGNVSAEVANARDQLVRMGAPTALINGLSALVQDTGRLAIGCRIERVSQYALRGVTTMAHDIWPSDFTEAPGLDFRGEFCSATPDSNGRGYPVTNEAQTVTFTGLHLSRYDGRFSANIVNSRRELVVSNLPLQVDGDVSLVVSLGGVNWGAVSVDAGVGDLFLEVSWESSWFSVPLEYYDPVQHKLDEFLLELRWDPEDWEFLLEDTYRELGELPRTATRNRVRSSMDEIRRRAEGNLLDSCSSAILGRFVLTELQYVRRRNWPEKYPDVVEYAPDICSITAREVDGKSIIRYRGVFFSKSGATFSVSVEDAAGNVVIPTVPLVYQSDRELEVDFALLRGVGADLASARRPVIVLKWSGAGGGAYRVPLANVGRE